MDSKDRPDEISLRYVEVVAASINGVSSFTSTINIPFTPDIMEVRYVHYFNGAVAAAGEPGVSLISCPGLVAQEAPAIICSFANSAVGQAPRTRFPLRKPINGIYQFTVLTSAGVADTSRSTNIVILLEFIRFAKNKIDDD